jgi:hypothetical protein
MIRQVDLAWAGLGVVEARHEWLRPEHLPDDRIDRIAPVRNELGPRPAVGRRAALVVTPGVRAAPSLVGGA